MESSSKARKCIMNSKDTVVEEALEGLCLFNPHLVRLQNSQVIALRNIQPERVSLICGGGSGHEPAHAGFVDEKLLTASVNGNVFASPPIEEIQMAIHHVSGEKLKSKGVLLIIKNYTGDVINFQLAAQYARAEGIQVSTLTVADDIAFIDENPDFRIEARGLTGTVLLYKALGAAAFSGAELPNLLQLGNQLLENTSTFGLSLGPCAIPGFPPNFSVPQDELEYGLGIHGEKGLLRAKMAPSKQISQRVVDQFFKRFQPESFQEIALVVNNLGSATDIQMSIFTKDTMNLFESKGVTVKALAVGQFMSSLQMHGVSVTVLNLTTCKHNKELLSYLFVEHNQGASFRFVQPLPKGSSEVECENNPLKNDINYVVERQYSQALLRVQVQAKQFFQLLGTKEEYLNKLDSVVGDGDTGSGVARACSAVNKEVNKFDFQLQFGSSLRKIGKIVARSFAGTSGPLYGAFLDAIGQRLKSNMETNQALDYIEAFNNGVKSVEQIGQAQVGERTMVDILRPLADELTQTYINGNQQVSVQDLLKHALTIAQLNSEQVVTLKAQKGRARYLGGKEIGHKDPGCELIVEWLTGLVEATTEAKK